MLVFKMAKFQKKTRKVLHKSLIYFRNVRKYLKVDAKCFTCEKQLGKREVEKRFCSEFASGVECSCICTACTVHTTCFSKLPFSSSCAKQTLGTKFYVTDMCHDALKCSTMCQCICGHWSIIYINHIIHSALSSQPKAE